MRIIPAIDIIGGKCVRLTKGDYNTKVVYNEEPLEVAKQLESYGFQYLHLVDLDGAKSNGIVNHKILYEIATKTSLQVDFGGGIKSEKDISAAFENGASQLTVGSIAATYKKMFLKWLADYGNEKIILGADCSNRKIATHGWKADAGIDIFHFIGDYAKEGIKYVICTDISKDGMLQGPSFGLYQDILKQTPQVNLIASGGITTLEDIFKLHSIGCEGAIIGKAIYEGYLSLEALSTLNDKFITPNKN